MFRISRYLQALHQGSMPRSGTLPGPVVIWNLARRCNLTCKHCYSASADREFPGELSTAELMGVMEDLRVYGVPVLILSGGEPMTNGRHILPQYPLYFAPKDNCTNSFLPIFLSVERQRLSLVLGPEQTQMG